MEEKGKKVTKTERKHREFAKQYVLNAYNACRAYMLAYQNDNKKTAASNAYKLLKKKEVQKYINEFEALPIANQISKSELIQDVIKVRNEAFAIGSLRDALKASEMLLKALGYNEAGKIEVDGNVDISIDFNFANDTEPEKD